MIAIRGTGNYIACCFANVVRPDIECYAEANAFSGCSDLIKDVGLRKLIWVMLLFTLLGNALVLVTRFFMEDKNVAQKVLIMSLGVSDVLMGIYLTIIAIKDETWRGLIFTTITNGVRALVVAWQVCSR